MRIWNLDGGCECDIGVFNPDTNCVTICFPGLPGPVGPVLIDVGSVTAPAEITTAIAPPVNRRQRSFVVGSGGPSVNPTLGNPIGSGPWELYLFCTSSVDTITLENQGNILLSGQWIGSQGSILYLQWDGNSMWVEGGRNEI